MRLENIVWDARDPRRLGRFWADALGAEVLTDEPDGVEVRLRYTEDFFLDLCFPLVAEPSTAPARLHPDLHGVAVQRLLDLGAAHVDIGQGAVPWTVLADPEGNAFCVMPDRDTGPIAALPLDSADPDRDADFWAHLTGWTRTGTTLRHPSGLGPLLELCPEPEPKCGKNRLHLDVRREAGDADAVASLPDLGATVLGRPAGLPWVVHTDPSGNEFCVLDETH